MVGWCSFILLWTYVDVHPLVNLFLWFTFHAPAGGCAFLLWTSIEVHSSLGYGGGLFLPVNTCCLFSREPLLKFRFTGISGDVHFSGEHLLIFFLLVFICWCSLGMWSVVVFAPWEHLLMYIFLRTSVVAHSSLNIGYCSFLAEHWLIFFLYGKIVSSCEHRLMFILLVNIFYTGAFVVHGSGL